MKPLPRAEALAAAVAGRDVEALGAELAEDVRLRALLPGGLEQVHGRAEVMATFRTWFGEHPAVVLDEATGDEVGDRLLVHYRLVFPEGERRVLTQTWVCTVAADGLLARIDLLCSGYRKF